VEKPDLTAAISANRIQKASVLEVDTLVSACPWSERPLGEAGQAENIDVVDIHELLAESLGIEVGGSRGVPGAGADPTNVATANAAAVDGSPHGEMDR